jgi:hypothetical protein
VFYNKTVTGRSDRGLEGNFIFKLFLELYKKFRKDYYFDALI